MTAGLQDQGDRSRPPRWVLWLLFATVLLVFVYPRHAWRNYRNVNEVARIHLVQALVRDGVLYIDKQLERYGDMDEKATFNGHFYCGKPPGPSLVALPVYGLMYGFERLSGREWSLQETRYLLTVFCISLPSWAALFLLYRYWTKLTGDGWLAALSVLIFSLGTMTCVYSTQFMSHQLSATLVILHFVLSRDSERGPGAGRLFLFGLMAGLGAYTQFFSSFIHLFIALEYLPRLRPLQRVLPLIGGGALALAPFLIYNALCFGGPFELGYGHESYVPAQKVHGQGFYSIIYPRSESVVGLLLSAEKGLFFLSPFLLLGLIGIPAAVRERKTRRVALVVLLSVVTIAFLTVSAVDWRAGWSVGPRQMVDMLPLLMTFVVLAVHRHEWLRAYYCVAAAIGVVFLCAATMTLPVFELNLSNPVVSQVLFLLRREAVSPNALTALGIDGAASLLLPVSLVLFSAIALLLGWQRFAGRMAPLHVVGAAVLGVLFLTYVAARDRGHPAVEHFHQGVLMRLVDRRPECVELMELAQRELPSPQMVERTSLELLRIHHDQQDLGAAVRVAERWLTLDPSSARARATLEQLRSMRGDSAGSPR